jgi:hypothetical protein
MDWESDGEAGRSHRQTSVPIFKILRPGWTTTDAPAILSGFLKPR